MDAPATNCLTTDVETSARILSVSPRTVWSLIRRGVIRPVRIGRRTLLRVADLRALAASYGMSSDGDHWG